MSKKTNALDGRVCYEEGAEFIKLFPEKDNKKSDVPVLVIFGWGARSLEQYKKPLSSLSKTRIVLGINTVFGASPLPRSSDTYKQKAYLLLGELVSHGITKVDVIACSEGAIISALAGSISPEMFRNIIFVNPAGFGAPRSTGEFIFAYVKELFSGVKEALVQKTFWKKTFRVCNGTIRRFLTHPRRSFLEASGIAGADVRQDLIFLKNKGIRLSLLLAKEDSLFPPKKVRSDTEDNLFVEIRESEGRHSSFIFNETDTVVEMLSVLENQKE
ncbi:MAG: hypothetical protein NTZ13_00900 [Candidatus Parcubacteria bacterium]|nr:hypothetical protein [Candidatus Parcubacteria bacterium]